MTWKHIIEENKQFNQNKLGFDWWRVTSKERCPVCNKPDGCLVNRHEEKYICIRVQGDFPVNAGIGGWLHDLTDKSPDWFDRAEFLFNKEQEYKLKADIEAEKYANKDQIHQFYLYLLNKYKLSNEDADYLITSGIYDYSDYGTFPEPDIFSCEFVPDIFPEGIPGLFKSRNNKYSYVNLNAFGMFRVIRDKDQFINGIEIRLSQACKERMAKYRDCPIEDIPKYMPLTSAKKNKGIKADPTLYGYVKPEEHENNHVLIITEGMKKAQIAANRMKCEAVGLRGVGLWHNLVNELTEKFSHVKEIWLAVDADYKTNKQVFKHRENLIEAIKDKKVFSLKTLEWNYTEENQCKGIDDALLSYLEITKKFHYKGEKIYKANEAGSQVEKDMRSIVDNPNGKLNLFKVTVGGGKTYSAIKIINEKLKSGNWFYKDGKPMRVLWLCDDNYDLLEETEKEFYIPPTRLMGRSDDPQSRFYCREKVLVDEAGQTNHNIIQSVCLKCPWQEECEYLLNSRDVLKKEKFVIGVKSSFFNESKRLDEFDLIFIDESISDSLYKTVELTKEDVENHISALNNDQNQHNYCDAKSNSIEMTEMYLSFLMTQIEEWEYKSQALNSEDFPPVNITETLRAIDGMETGYENKKQFNDDGESFFLKKFIGDVKNAQVYVYKGGIFIDIPQNNMIEQLRSKTVINLDATPRLSKMNVISNNIKIHEYKVEEHQNIFQITNLKGSKGQLMGDKYQQTFLECIKEIATRIPGQKTVVLAIKSFADVVLEYARRENFYIEVGWYGNHTRGFNKFKDADNIILAGNYCRNLDYMRMQVETLNAMGANVTLEDLITEDTYNEMIQAAGRGRATRRTEENKLNLFLLTSTPMKCYGNIHYIPNMESIIGSRKPNQQDGNEMRKAMAEQAAREHIEALSSEKDFWIPNLKYSQEALAAGVSPEVMKSVMKKEYQQVLLDKCSDPDRMSDYITLISNELRSPTFSEINALGLKLTHLRTSILSKYSLSDLRHVISQDMSVYNHFKHHIPAGVNTDKWLKVLDGVHDVNNLKLTINKLAPVIDVSRQVLTKYLKLMMERLCDVPVVDHQVTDYIPEDWDVDTFENDSILLSWASEIIEESKNNDFEDKDFVCTLFNIPLDLKDSLSFEVKNLISEYYLCPVDYLEYKKAIYNELNNKYSVWLNHKGLIRNSDWYDE